jgi:hypothetical protein
VVEKGTGRPPPVSAVTIRTWLGDLMVRAAAAASPEGPRPWQVPVESEFSVLATEMMLQGGSPFPSQDLPWHRRAHRPARQ